MRPFAIWRDMKRKAKKSKRKTTKKNRRSVVIASVVTAVCLLSVALIFVFAPKPVHDKPSFFETQGEFVSGIDVSYHNGEIDWEETAKNVDFAIIRVGYMGYSKGNIVEDEQFKRNIKGANKAGIPVGVYFYSQAVNVHEARKEADFVLSKIIGCDVDLPIFIDYEYAFNKDGMMDGRLFNAHLSRDEAAKVINAFCDRINKGGYYAGLYSSSSVLNNEIKTKSLNNNIYIWAADYNDAVTYNGEYDLWQYTKTGKCPGVPSEYTDLNRWYVK